MKDADWKTIEEEKPDLFEEAVAGVVAKSDCDAHAGRLAKIEINFMVIQPKDRDLWPRSQYLI